MGKIILALFALVFIIGYFQGLIEQLVTLPVDLGLLKYALLLLAGILWLRQVILRGRLQVSRGILPYMLLWAVFYGLFAWALFQSLRSNDGTALLVQTLSLWAVLNVPLVLLINSALPSLAPVYQFLRWLVWLGVLAAFFGIIQYILGPERMQGLGFRVYDAAGGFALLQTNENVVTFRVFSVFASHYEFASFMVVSILAHLVLQLRRRCLDIKSIFIFCILLLGLLVTFNLTLWLTLSGIIAVFLVGSSGKGLRVLKNKRLWQALVGLVLLGIMLIVVLPSARERVLGAFAFGDNDPGQAGTSLYWRTVVFSTSLNLIQEFPLGLGLTVIPALERLMLERGYFLVTADIFFTWLMLSGGLPLFLCYLLLFVVPLAFAFKRRHQVPQEDRALFWAIWAAVFVGVLLGGLSNAADQWRADEPVGLGEYRRVV